MTDYRPVLSWKNWCEAVGTTISATSEAGTLTASNLLKPPLRQRLRTVAGATTLTLKIDFGAIRPIKVLALAQPDDAGWFVKQWNDGRGGYNGLLSSSDTIRHRLSLLGPDGAEVLDTSTVAGGWRRGMAVSVLGSEVSARYWTIDIAASSLAPVPGIIDLGLLWAGPAWQSRGIAYGWQETLADTATVSRAARTGTTIISAGVQALQAEIRFPSLPVADRAYARDLAAQAGVRGLVLAHLRPDDAEGIPPFIARIDRPTGLTQPRPLSFEQGFTLVQAF